MRVPEAVSQLNIVMVDNSSSFDRKSEASVPTGKTPRSKLDQPVRKSRSDVYHRLRRTDSAEGRRPRNGSVYWQCPTGPNQIPHCKNVAASTIIGKSGQTLGSITLKTSFKAMDHLHHSFAVTVRKP